MTAQHLQSVEDDDQRNRAGRFPAPARLLLLALFAVAPSGCNLPCDPEQTLEHVRGGKLRVGVILDAPWTNCGAADATPEGVEVGLVEKLASELDAEVQWSHGGDARLMTALEQFELDVVIGGVVADSAWKKRVALSRPYFVARPAGEPDARSSSGEGHKKREHVFAVPPGENAWLLYVDDFLQRHRDDVPRLLDQYATSRSSTEDGRR